MPFHFTLTHQEGSARAGRFITPHGVVETPQFMPVGTLASVKSLDPDDLTRLGATMILANAYHLELRPGRERSGRWADCISSCSGPVPS